MISDNVEVLGALTDEQTPIQPEGTTQTLREVDNIFMEVRSPFADATVGKFDAASGISEFTAFSRRLEGIKGVVRPGRVGTTGLVAALSPGSFRSQEFTGREGDQGPYRLTGEDGSRGILVIAGSERVWVDGIEMIRGRDNDYVIDYALGEVTFQPRQLITANSKILVDFEFSERNYSRSFLHGSHSTFLADSSLRVSLSAVREADDPDSPLDMVLTESDRALIAAAGAQPELAVRSGVNLVGSNDTVRGSYRAVDTVINGSARTVYEYDPGHPEAIYDVRFSRAPDGRGDYRSVAFGRFEFVGIGAGEYLPLEFLALPREQSVASLGATYSRGQGLVASGEIAGSHFNLNRLSDDPETTTDDVAGKFTLQSLIDDASIFSLPLGRTELRAEARYVGGAFRSVSRLGDVEFDRKWNTEQRTSATDLDEFTGEAMLQTMPLEKLTLRSEVGLLRREELLSTLRGAHGLSISSSTPVYGDLRFEHLHTDDRAFNPRNSTWLKGFGRLAWRTGALTPGVTAAAERRLSTTPGENDLLPESFQYVAAGPTLQVVLPFLRTDMSLIWRDDDSLASPSDLELSEATDARTFRLDGALTGIRALRSTALLTWRTFREATAEAAGSSTILARSESRWNPYPRGLEVEALYEVQTEQASRLQRLFVRVPVGEGRYIWVDLDSNNVQTENEFRETIAGDGEYARVEFESEELRPVIDLETMLRIRLRPASLPGSDSLNPFLRSVALESLFRLEEKSQTENRSDIYLLNLPAYFNDSTTLRANALIQQDLYLFETSDDFRVRLRFSQRQTLLRLIDAPERSAVTERSIRTTWNPTTDLGFQFEAGLEDRSLLGEDVPPSRGYDLDIVRASNEFTYRPARDLEFAWEIRFRSAEDFFTPQQRSALLTTNILRGVYSLLTKGQIRASIERSVIAGESLDGEDLFSLPFQLTDGYGVGTTWIGRFGFDYRIGANVQASINYSARAEPPSMRVVHLGQAELRAFF